MDSFVTIAHPGIAGTAAVSERALGHYRALGWLPVDTDDNQPPTPPQSPSDTPIGDELAARHAPADDPAAVTEENPA